MATFKEFDVSSIKTSKSFLNQTIDIINEDISGSTTRKQYQVFVTGGIGPGVTSSLFQTVFDQDFTLETANPVFDVTFGFYSGSTIVTDLSPTIDSNGKYIFPSQSMMMREKMDMYRLFAQSLVGDADSLFNYQTISGSIKNALFIAFKRLFTRDQMRRETFAIKFTPTASNNGSTNIDSNSTGAPKIYSDIGSSQNKLSTFGGQISSIVDSSDTSNEVGLLFIDKGVAVLDIDKVFDNTVSIYGTIEGMSTTGYTTVSASFPKFLASASIDDALDHICSTRFTGSAASSITFQSITNINSSIFFCRLGADEFNYSSNPTYIDTNNRIVVIDSGQEETQQSFTFVTSVGLYDANDNLLAVAKLSRPVLKDSERDITLRVRTDFARSTRMTMNTRKRFSV